MTKPKLNVKMKGQLIIAAFPILWSLNTEDVGDVHTPILVHLSRKPFGNMQKVIKTNSAKGSLAKVRIHQRCPPICCSISL